MATCRAALVRMSMNSTYLPTRSVFDCRSSGRASAARGTMGQARTDERGGPLMANTQGAQLPCTSSVYLTRSEVHTAPDGAGNGPTTYIQVLRTCIHMYLSIHASASACIRVRVRAPVIPPENHSVHHLPVSDILRQAHQQTTSAPGECPGKHLDRYEGSGKMGSCRVPEVSSPAVGGRLRSRPGEPAPLNLRDSHRRVARKSVVLSRGRGVRVRPSCPPSMPGVEEPSARRSR